MLQHGFHQSPTSQTHMLNHRTPQIESLSTRRSTAFSISAPTGWDWRQRLSRQAENSANEPVLTEATRTPKMARLEAALFVTERALSLRKLVQMATLADAKEAQSLIDQLNVSYDQNGSAFRIEKVAAGFKMFTLPHLSKWLDRVNDRQSYMKLSPPAMETLAIIAYRQPCTRADVEAVRGVQAAEMIKQLMEKSLVRIVGEDDSLGRPYLYGTTKLFLESFGLTRLDQLPMADQLVPKQAEVDDKAESSTDEDSEADDTQTEELDQAA